MIPGAFFIKDCYLRFPIRLLCIQNRKIKFYAGPTISLSRLFWELTGNHFFNQWNQNSGNCKCSKSLKHLIFAIGGLLLGPQFMAVSAGKWANFSRAHSEMCVRLMTRNPFFAAALRSSFYAIAMHFLAKRSFRLVLWKNPFGQLDMSSG